MYVTKKIKINGWQVRTVFSTHISPITTSSGFFVEWNKLILFRHYKIQCIIYLFMIIAVILREKKIMSLLIKICLCPISGRNIRRYTKSRGSTTHYAISWQSVYWWRKKEHLEKNPNIDGSVWESDCCLTPIQQFFSYITVRTS
jgi:hypothetical protein